MTSAAGDAPAPRGRARRIGGLAAGLLVVAFLAAALIGGWDTVTGYDWRFDAGFIALAVACISGSLACMGVGYVLLLERLSGKRLARLRLLSIWSRSMLARYVPGNVMMIAGRLVLGREAGVGGRVTLAASVYEHAFLLGVCALASIGLLVSMGDLGQGPWLWLVAAVPLGLVLLHPRIFGAVSSFALRKVGREPLETLLSLREMLAFAALYTLVCALLGAGVWAAVRALAGPEAGGVALVGAGFLLSFVVSMVAFVFPSGLGVREGIFAVVLADALPGGVAIAAAGASRIALTIVELAFAAAVIALASWRGRARSRPTS